jgi:5'(3')-deoxyribonucleotidase
VSKRNLIVVVDLDETVVDLFTPWLAMYNKEWDDSLTPSDVLSYAIHEHVKPDCGHRIYDYLNLPGLFSEGVQALPGAVNALQTLVNEGHQVIIATAAFNKETHPAEKQEWCRQNLPFIPTFDVHVVEEKWRIPGDVFIDDSPHQVSAYRKAHPSAQIFGLCYPYNENAKEYDLLVPYQHKAAAWKCLLQATLAVL